MSFTRDYPWAINKVKLAQSIAKLENLKSTGRVSEINEDAIKKEYVSRAGLVIEAPKAPVKEEEAAEEEAPKVKPKAKKE